MRKLNLNDTRKVTFEDGCNKYLDYCRQRNLRDGTINHYKQSYKQFYKYFDPQMPVEDIDENAYKYYEHNMSHYLAGNSASANTNL